MTTDTATTTLASCPRHLRRSVIDSMVDLALPHMNDPDANALVKKAWAEQDDGVGVFADPNASGDPVGNMITYLDQLHSRVYSKQVPGPTTDVRDRMYKAMMRRAFADREWGKQITVGGLDIYQLDGDDDDEEAEFGEDGYSSLSDEDDSENEGEEEEDDSSSEEEEEETVSDDAAAAKRQKRE